MFKIIILIFFCLIAALCGRWAKEVSNKINEPIKMECQGGLCPAPEEYKIKRGGDDMDWYWLAGIAAIIAGLYYWFYIR